MKKLVRDAEDRDEIPKREYKIESRGIFVLNNNGANEQAISVMDEIYDADISSHKAKQFSEEDIEDSYLIFTMTEEHKYVILSNWPEAKDKVFVLKEFAQILPDEEIINEPVHTTNYDLKDPYGGTYEDYKEAAGEIYEALLKVIDKIF